VTDTPTECYNSIYYIHMMKPTLSFLLLVTVIAGCYMRIPYPHYKGFIPMGDARIYYQKGGGNGNSPEPVILLHAGFLDTEMWNDQAGEFSREYQLIAIDIPGHGKTENDTIRLLPAEFILAVMDSLKIQKASLVGVSFGAACATEFAIAHPERINKIVLTAAGINGWESKFGSDPAIEKYLSSFFGAFERKDSAGAAEIFTQTWFDGPYRKPHEVHQQARKYIYETTLSNIRKHKVRGWPIFAEPPAIENLSKIKNPVLIIHGDKDMRRIDSTSAYLEKTIPGAKRIMIPGTGHMVNMEAPKEFNKAVLDFLAQ
jgi:3-oxoadipate enol-lactonase